MTKQEAMKLKRAKRMAKRNKAQEPRPRGKCNQLGSHGPANRVERQNTSPEHIARVRETIRRALEAQYGMSVIHMYTRAEAVRDGVLVDVTDTAERIGFQVPVALTEAVWRDCVEWDEATDGAHQQQAARLKDLLFNAACMAQRGVNTDTVYFRLARVPVGETRAEEVELKSHSHPGDLGEHVVTIMFPDED